MPIPPWREAPIHRTHDRKGFDCGVAELNSFVAQYARQAHEGGAAKTYCAIAKSDDKTILGFYTLTPGQVHMSQVPLAARPSGAGHHALSGIRLARLAVSKDYQGQQLGGHLLARAIGRSIRVSSEIGGTALLIDAKDTKGAAWYALYGAMPLDDQPLSLVLSYAAFNKARMAAGLSPITS